MTKWTMDRLLLNPAVALEELNGVAEPVAYVCAADIEFLSRTPEGWDISISPRPRPELGMRMALYAAPPVPSVAVAEIVSKHGDPEAFGERELVALVDIQKFPYRTKLYAAAPAKQDVDTKPTT